MESQGASLEEEGQMGVGGRDPDCGKWGQEVSDLGQGRE